MGQIYEGGECYKYNEKSQSKRKKKSKEKMAIIRTTKIYADNGHKYYLTIINDVAEDNDCDDNYNYPLQNVIKLKVWRKTETTVMTKLVMIETITIMMISYNGMLLMLLILEESLLLMFVSL